MRCPEGGLSTDKFCRGDLWYMAVRTHLFISGEVQGVGFRWAVEDKARAADITGWVRNLPDGRVEAVFEGDEEQVQRMIEFCRRGPTTARVEDVQVIPEEYSGECTAFSILR